MVIFNDLVKSWRSCFVWNKNRKSYAILLLLALSVGAWLWFSRQETEPVYQGKTLSQWLQPLRLARQSEASIVPESTLQESRLAIEAMGTDAIPSLERRMHARYDAANALWQMLSGIGLTQWCDQIGLRVVNDALLYPARRAGTKHAEAQIGFEVLGELGMPTLRKLLLEPDSNQALTVLYVMRNLGPTSSPAIPELSALLRKSSSATVRSRAADTMNFIGSNEAITAALTNGLSDSDVRVRVNAALSLGRIEPAGNAASRARTLGRFDGTGVLGRGGIDPTARNAIPALTKALADSDPNVRAAAQFALDQIATVAIPLVAP